MEAPATDQDVIMAGEASQPQAPVGSVNSALKILMRNATDEFGHAPRDVYQGIYELHRLRRYHDDTVRSLSYQALQDHAKWLSFGVGFSDRILEVYPRPQISAVSDDRWTFSFKSDQIARKVAVKMEEVSRGQTPSGHIDFTAGRIGIMYHILARGW
jgi:hypothetical protein